MRFGGYAPQNLDRHFRGADDARGPRCSARATCRRWRCSTRSDRRSCWRGCAGPAPRPVLPPGRARRASPSRSAGWALTPGGPRRRSTPPIARGGEAVALSAEPARGAGGRARGCWARRRPGRSRDVLRGAPPPANGAPDRIAFKTGTSYGHRDAWAIGFDGAHVDRRSGSAGRTARRCPACSGSTPRRPALFDAFARLESARRPAAAAAARRADRRPTPSCPRRCAASSRAGGAEAASGPAHRLSARRRAARPRPRARRGRRRW